MSPLLWATLFTFFTTIYSLFLVSNYFIKVPQPPQTPYKAQFPNKFKWKW
uniref:ATP synthase Fo subunit 8 n=1 Tax=Caridina sp. 1 Solomon TaxID=2493609 RepID=A0A3Q8LZS7_9EUCA|nr:ATP synthase Fo subunit 8 [Caridina sp. 1 Solomon]AZH80570.1 ATP synthase Fo subunit 8 [Caridina sp. 1 Solomon]